MKKQMATVFITAAIIFLMNSCAPASTPLPSASTPIPPVTSPEPTSTPFIMPKGDFELSWNVYNSQYDSLGGIVTIRRAGAQYTETRVMPDKSCNTLDLTVISEGDELVLTEQPGTPSNDQIEILSNGYLAFTDNQGLIYSVPPLTDVQTSDTVCIPGVPEQGKEFNVSMSLLSVENIGGNDCLISISTNLPEGMKLMAKLINSGDYWAQDDPTVEGGKIEMTFGNVVPGNFQLAITSPSVSIQPENVKSIVGENGANMTGEFIIYDPLWNGYFLEYKTNIEIK